MTLRVGTRASQLAREQAGTVTQALETRGHSTETVPIRSHGDASRAIPIERIGVAGAFTAALEQALVEEEIDLAVHSLKDLPVEPAPGLTLAAILPRGRPEDALIVRPEAHAPDRDPPLAEGTRVATSGPRRRSQLLAADDTLVPVDVRGNVDTRLAKLRAGFFDALVMAYVALERADLDTSGLAVEPLDPARFPCAPGQAAIAVQAREGSSAVQVAQGLDDGETRTAVELERTVLDELGGGCGLPLGAWASRTDGAWRIRATFAGPAWTPASAPRVHRVVEEGGDPDALARRVAESLAEVEAGPRHPVERVPLPEGAPVLVVASEPTARRYTAHLRDAGLAAVPVPTRTFEPAKPPEGDERRRLRDADWVVATSRRAAGPLGALLGEDPPDAYVGTVGPATARALQGEGVPVHLVAPEGTAASLAHEVARLTDEPGTVLLALGDTARDEAPRILVDAGFETRRWTAYRTHEIAPDLAALDVELPARAAIVTSPRSARALPLSEPSRVADRFVAFGPTTAEALRARGIEPDVAPAPRPDTITEMLT